MEEENEREEEKLRKEKREKNEKSSERNERGRKRSNNDKYIFTQSEWRHKAMQTKFSKSKDNSTQEPSLSAVGRGKKQ